MPDPTLLAIAASILAIIGIVALLVVRRGKNTDEAPTPPPPVRYKVALYNNGEVVRSIRAVYASPSESGLYVQAEGDQNYTILGGCFVMEPIDAPATAPRTPASKYKVTLYDAGKIIREWYATYTSPSKSGLYLQPEGATDYTVIGGTFLVEPIT